MAFGTATRNELQRMVGAARACLVDEFTTQCQRDYGIQPDGSMQPLGSLGHLDEDQRVRAALLRERARHIAAGLAGKTKDADAVKRLVREQAFTVLNRLCALRMCEERGLLQECIRGGYESKGFRLFDQPTARPLGVTYERYRLYLELLFDELAVDLGVLFDRYSLHGLLFPGENALKATLELIDASELAHVWAEDEGIGWVYQYFNSEEERRRMRQESSAPRNSRELAVRNQFFTPRYVVEFLTDNTLGRIWYEMRRGETKLVKRCRYLLRCPSENFLAAGELFPDDEGEGERVEQAKSLTRSMHIVHRERKDPRDLKVLDPASGSGHFLLYAFDLLETIYEEAWVDPGAPASEKTGTRLREDYSTTEDLRAALPALILRHNLWGVDIDPRARPDCRPRVMAPRATRMAGPGIEARRSQAPSRKVEYRFRRANAGGSRVSGGVHGKASSPCIGATGRDGVRENAPRGRGRLAAQDRARDRSGDIHGSRGVGQRRSSRDGPGRARRQGVNGSV